MHTLRADVFFRKEENIGRVYILEGAMALTRRYFTLVNMLLISYYSIVINSPSFICPKYNSSNE